MLRKLPQWVASLLHPVPLILACQIFSKPQPLTFLLCWGFQARQATFSLRLVRILNKRRKTIVEALRCERKERDVFMAVKMMQPLHATAWRKLFSHSACAHTDEGGEGCSCQLGLSSPLPSEMRRQNIKSSASTLAGTLRYLESCWSIYQNQFHPGYDATGPEGLHDMLALPAEPIWRPGLGSAPPKRSDAQKLSVSLAENTVVWLYSINVAF